MWSSGPAAQGQFSGNAWREQVITRQPALAKRLTVAWPMPRLAPVKISVRRSWLLWLIPRTLAQYAPKTQRATQSGGKYARRRYAHQFSEPLVIFVWQSSRACEQRGTFEAGRILMDDDLSVGKTRKYIVLDFV